MTFIRGKLPGILMTIAIALPAWYLGNLVPVIGGPVFGILFGILIALWQRPRFFAEGINYSAKIILQASIILLGFEMNLFNVVKVGSQSLYVMIFTLGAAFVSAWLVGRSLKLAGNTSILIGVGTAICGGSAIAATAPVIRANEKEVAYSISTIFLFNILAVFIFPLLGHLLKMSDYGFGMWAGTAINDTSSVVAAGYTYSYEAGNFATIVKLTRTLLIIPVTLVLAALMSRNGEKANNFSFTKVFPYFILGFLAASIITTFSILPAELCSALAEIGKFCIVVAMSAIGLNTHIKNLVTNGLRPILLGLCCWVVVAIVSLITQHIFQQW